MVTIFAKEIAGIDELGKNWTRRFVLRHQNQLDSAYLRPLDKQRKKAENYNNIQCFFELLGEKVVQYNIQPHNTYNMDEKGQMIGFMQQSKRIFSKGSALAKELIGNVQDGNREWITVLASICADQTWLPPALIYKASTGLLQDSWLQDFDEKQHLAFFTSSPNGWTDNKIGLAWLKEVFDRFSKPKARNGRDWRLLIIDGHGSHVTMEFVNWAIEHHIFICVFPPHITHRMQPLDVSLFAPLAQHYHSALDQHMTESQGLTAITKRDFFRLFWPSYQKAFSSDNIASGFKKTGIYPLEPSIVLSKITKPQEQLLSSTRPASSGSSILSASNWREIRRLVTEATKDAVTSVEKEKVHKLQDTVMSLTTEVALLRAENYGFQRSLNNEKKKRKRGKTLIEEVRAEGQQGGIFWSPSKISRAMDLQAARDQAKKDKQAETIQKKKDQALKTAQARIAVEQRKLQRLQARQEKEVHKTMDRQAKEVETQLQHDLQASAKPAQRTKVVLEAPIDQPVFVDPSKVSQPAKKPKQPAARKRSTLQQPTKTVTLQVDFSKLSI